MHKQAASIEPPTSVSPTQIARAWTRIGCVGFGGPPAHIALFRELCVDQRGWMDARDFEDAIAATNLLPGPGSTQLAIYCAWRLGGARGALIGGLGFILPGLLVILGLSSIFLASAPPAWIRGAGAGAGAAVAAVALHAGVGLLVPAYRRLAGIQRARWMAFVVVGAAGAVFAGPWLVLLLLACGFVELVVRWPGDRGLTSRAALHAWPIAAPVLAMATAAGTTGALVWMAFKVGALAYGGGFVIVPLMQAEAVDHYGWMTDAQFLNGVALGQVTPGPVVHTVAVVGYAAAGLPGAILVAAVAFAPSFSFILLGGRRFDALLGSEHVRAFLDGAGPAAIGAIAGSAIWIASTLTEPWQAAVVVGAVVSLFVLRRGVVTTLLAAGAIGAIVVG